MMRRLKILFCLVWVGLPGCGGRPSESGREEAPLSVFAAISLADAFTEAGQAFDAEREGSNPTQFNFAASNDLGRQIAAGAPADLFVAANQGELEKLVPGGRVRQEDIVPVASNRLVVVVPARDFRGELAEPAGLLSFARLGLADPTGVPLGLYSRQWLERLGLWAGLEPRVVPLLDARATLAAVAAGNLPAAIVYKTDTQGESRVRVVFEVPREEGPDVRIWAAPVFPVGGGPSRGPSFLAFLRGERGRAILLRHGFEPTPPE